MNKNQLIKELLEIEAMADLLSQKCRKARKLMEGVSTPSLQKGYEAEVAKVVANFRMKSAKKKALKNHQ